MQKDKFLHVVTLPVRTDYLIWFSLFCPSRHLTNLRGSLTLSVLEVPPLASTLTNHIAWGWPLDQVEYEELRGRVSFECIEYLFTQIASADLRSMCCLPLRNTHHSIFYHHSLFLGAVIYCIIFTSCLMPVHNGNWGYFPCYELFAVSVARQRFYREDIWMRSFV